MANTALAPVFVGLRLGLHVLFVALIALVIGRAVVDVTDASPAVVIVAVLLLATYAAGAYGVRFATRARRFATYTPGDHGPRSSLRIAGYAWILALTVEWLAVLWLISEAAYLVFPLFFLYLHLLPRPFGPIAVVVATALAVTGLGMHGGWSAAIVIGPAIGAGVAILVGLGYQSLAREAAERERLVDELIATQDRLAAAKHESGVLAERARLAREIHDTLAQGLSSIQMLLHAAERADDTRPGIEHVRLARETAAANLADTRRFIRALAPPALDEQGLAGALRRLAETQWQSAQLSVQVRVADSLALPMHIQTALLRIVQSAMANVIRHADARTATIEITRAADAVRLVVSDDGRGFDVRAESERPVESSGSFGLTSTRERVDQLGGALEVASEPGGGTTLSVELAVEDE